MIYSVEYDRQSQNFLEKLDKQIARRIVDRVDSLLGKEPVPRDAKAIVGEHGVFRVRI